MDFGFGNIQEASSTVWQWGADQASSLGAKTVEFSQAAAAAVSPFLGVISEKVQAVWSNALPYLNTVVQFLTSNLGIATMLLGGTIICMTMARQSKNTLASAIWMTAGVASAVASGALLVGASILSPNLPLLAFSSL